MNKFVLSCLLTGSLLPVANLRAQQKDYPITPVPFTDVKLTDAFWSPRIEMNRTVTIPASFARCESTGRVHNFVLAAKRQGKFATKFPFDDTDIYKTIEGASYSLAVHPDAVLSAYVDALIDTVGRAQESDGYLYTARTIDSLHPHPWSGPDRWVKENEGSHELYNSGHMFEAAAAHYLATGKRNFLDIALRNADLLVRTFGPGKREVAPGHEIVEMGLVRLYRITGRKEYLDLAKFFIDARGKRAYDKTSNNVWKNGEYWQDDKPLVDQDVAEGHAVRAMYLYSGVADVAALTGDKQYVEAIDRIWNDMAGRKLYVQGGIGAVPDGERFGDDYYLPNGTAYNETCAAIGDVFWNQRMFLLHGESKYIDLVEKVLYNGFLSGIGLDGKSFFYTNAMQVTDKNYPALERERSGWFECSCCPTNVLRLLPSIPGYIYAQKEDELYVNLFISGKATLKMSGRPLEIVQKNNYPWDGALSFTINPADVQRFSLKLRIPGWARGSALPTDLYAFEQDTLSSPPVAIRINGQPVKYSMANGYAVLTRDWKKGDELTCDLPMPVRRVVASPWVVSDRGQVAIQRGPLMYCAEWADNRGIKVDEDTEKVADLIIPTDCRFVPATRPDLLGGVTVLKGTAAMVAKYSEDAKTLYQEIPVTLIPYYAWANRGKGEMTVWFPER